MPVIAVSPLQTLGKPRQVEAPLAKIGPQLLALSWRFNFLERIQMVLPPGTRNPVASLYFRDDAIIGL